MTSQKIKEECTLMYEQIRNAETRLSELRKICQHQNTKEGNYSWRIGSVLPAVICSDCGELIKYKEF